jgi:murein DD-endopeptidase MepM/ murein hydrolase activator NlpD
LPPRRPARGRHRKPKSSGAPAYLTAATLAAFVVSGVNVQGAIGAARTTDRPQAEPDARVPVVTAAAERVQANAQQLRASRDRDAAEAVIAREARAAAKRAAEAAKAAAEAAKPDWVKPVLNFSLSAGFGESSGLWSHRHTGQDFAAPVGTPVRAIGDGKIISATWDGAYGRKIIVEHTDGTVSWYAHLSAFVQTSGAVRAGDVIGRVGSTGNSTGAHLHLEIRPDGGDPVPPIQWLARHGVRL